MCRQRHLSGIANKQSSCDSVNSSCGFPIFFNVKGKWNCAETPSQIAKVVSMTSVLPRFELVVGSVSMIMIHCCWKIVCARHVREACSVVWACSIAFSNTVLECFCPAMYCVLIKVCVCWMNVDHQRACYSLGTNTSVNQPGVALNFLYPWRLNLFLFEYMKPYF